jgi:hypothetical protein
MKEIVLLVSMIAAFSAIAKDTEVCVEKELPICVVNPSYNDFKVVGYDLYKGNEKIREYSSEQTAIESAKKLEQFKVCVYID